MYSRMKRKCSFIVLVVMVVSLLMVSGMPVQADSYSWMESAKKVKINSTIKGVARNNQPPTLMDPWDSYEEYFYFKAPVKMNITITVTMKGTQGVSVSLYNSRGNYLMDSNDWLYNRSKNQNSTILRSTCNAGEYYIRLMELYNSNSEKHPYSLTVQGKLLNSTKITKIQRRYRYFTLWDIDKDGLKELLVTDGREQVGNSPTKAYAYTYTRGKLRYAGEIGSPMSGIVDIYGNERFLTNADECWQMIRKGE